MIKREKITFNRFNSIDSIDSIITLTKSVNIQSILNNSNSNRTSEEIRLNLMNSNPNRITEQDERFLRLLLGIDFAKTKKLESE